MSLPKTGFGPTFHGEREAANLQKASEDTRIGGHMRNSSFKTLLGAATLALALSGPALAADMPVKAAPAPAPAAPDFDIAFGGGLMSDYLVRGITQTNHGATATAYFEPRYKEFYVGVAGTGLNWLGSSVNLNDPSAEIDFYGGWRPTVGKWTFDLGYIYYNYARILPVSAGFYNADFYEFYGKASYAVTDQLTIGGAVYYSPNLLNYGNQSDYWEANAKWVGPTFGAFGSYVSGAYGYFHVANGDNGNTGIKVPSYSTWNASIGFTWKALTLDLRYSDTNLSAGECQAFWATGAGTPQGNRVDGWCKSQFVAKLTFDLLASALK
jgi:uncharacterized protein (TIGR02001 family)